MIDFNPSVTESPVCRVSPEMAALDPWSPFMLEGEEAVNKFDGICLRNTHDSGVLIVTNFRFLFMSKGTINKLGTIPLTTVDKVFIPQSLSKGQDAKSFKIFGYDMRVLEFVLESGQEFKLCKMVEILERHAKPSHFGHLFAFALNPTPPAVANRISPDLRLMKEYQRLFHKWFPHSPTSGFEVQKLLDNKWWRVTEVNSEYSLCSTYPSRLIVPHDIRDDELNSLSTCRARCRLPVISWCNPETGAVLARSSQPKGTIGFRKDCDERLVSALRTKRVLSVEPLRKLYIVDARPSINATANAFGGGGTESASSYQESEVVYLTIENIHVMRKSLESVREYVDKYGSVSSKGPPLAGSAPGDPENRGSNFFGVTLNSTTEFSSMLGTWLNHIEHILVGASWIAAKIAHESAAVLVHCSDGWDRTTQLVGLASLLIDPYYRTFTGFQALVEKDWLAFGHQFALRMGLPTKGMGRPSVLEISPVLLQWLECIAQLLRMYPFAFEFSPIFLVDFMDAVLSCQFGNFLCNSEKERKDAEVARLCPCIWEYLADLRASGGTFHKHRNPFYEPARNTGPIVPPAPALAPTLWPEFYLRWACPLESEGVDHEALKAKSRIVELESLLAEQKSSHTDTSDAAKPGGRSIRTVGSNVKTK